ncbi:peptidase S14 [Sphingomonas jatrophae]|uniref:ATP-dependent protease ClpP, protease subunit n=1 Tax=Sphingomonas jatrophae TaxID=1166337 RepID=A0A1I6JKQ1_9SPHN|nr:peptidase S14 [Sphingomonas jatrophae]SFR79588.1 hypothetical protein SAMN05192580_0418 [Sphingomonas jatrophae]
MTDQTLTAADFRDPAVLLSGDVDYEMYRSFRDQLAAAPAEGLVVCELSTLGGDPEVARMMGEDIRFHSDLEAAQRRFVFLGKAVVYSAGVTFMSFFARQNRFLTRGSRLMIHERKMSKDVELRGPLTKCLATAEAAVNELKASIAMQEEGFANLVQGSSVTLEEVIQRAPTNWYVEAQEAKALGLVEAVL